MNVVGIYRKLLVHRAIIVLNLKRKCQHETRLNMGLRLNVEFQIEIYQR